jgi:ATP-dependent RNA helicase SUPV3L1/SUV3
MPNGPTVDFLAIDEIQLAADLERGHVFTDRLLTCAAATRPCCSAPRPCAAPDRALLPGVNFVTRPRLSR